MSIRVLQVIASLAPVHGGPSYAVRVVEGALKREGIHCETATTDDDGPDRRLVRPLGAPIDEEGARRWYFRKDHEFYKCSWSFARWIWRHATDYDVLHIHGLFSFTSSAAALAARYSHVPYVLHPFGTLNSYGLERRRKYLKKASLFALEKRLVKSAAAIHYSSDSEKRQAEDIGLNGCGVIIPLALDPSALFSQPEMALTDKKPIILFLSRLDPVKNAESLLQAFALLSNTNAHARLVMAGTGDPGYVDALKKLAADLGISGSVIWAGHVSGQQKADLLQAAMVFVLPSHSESFGLALAEALAAGVPAVAAKGVALANRMSEEGAGVLVEPQSEDIARGIQMLLVDAQLRSTMAEKGRRFARSELDAGLMGQRLHNLYRSVVARHQRRVTDDQALDARHCDD